MYVYELSNNRQKQTSSLKCLLKTFGIGKSVKPCARFNALHSLESALNSTLKAIVRIEKKKIEIFAIIPEILWKRRIAIGRQQPSAKIFTPLPLLLKHISTILWQKNALWNTAGFELDSASSSFCFLSKPFFWSLLSYLHFVCSSNRSFVRPAATNAGKVITQRKIRKKFICKFIFLGFAIFKIFQIFSK